MAISAAKAPSVHIVLDTNCLFTEAEGKLLASELSSYITEQAPELGLKIAWYLPHVVRGERKRQMLEKALRLLEPLAKLEGILGHNLAITAQTINERIEARIEDQIQTHKLISLPLDYSQVDWDRLVNSAIERHPPFSPDKSEKGFKDALILESVVQLANTLPKSPQAARIVLLCNDSLLSAAANSAFGTAKNFFPASSLSDLRTMLTAIASHLSQEAVDELVSKARAMFWLSKEAREESLYVRFGVWSEMYPILQKNIAPEPGYNLSDRKTFVNATSFVGKTSQTVTFSTEIVVQSVAKKTVALGLGRGLSALLGESYPSRIGERRGLASLLESTEPSPSQRSELGTQTLSVESKVVFDVAWTATLTHAGNLTRPKLKSIVHRDTTWSEPVVLETN